MKTVCYGTLLLVAFIILAVFTFQTERTKTVELDGTYEAYKKAEQFDPTCECSAKSTRISMFNDLNTVRNAYLNSATRKDGLLYADGQPTHICSYILESTDNVKSGIAAEVQNFINVLLENAVKPRCDLIQATGFTSVKVLTDQTVPNRELASRQVFTEMVWSALSDFDLAQGSAYFSMEKNSIIAGVSPRLGFSPGINLYSALGSSSTDPGCTNPQSSTYTSAFTYTINGVESTGYCYIPTAVVNINMRTFKSSFAQQFSSSDLSSYNAYPFDTDMNFEVYFANLTDYFLNRGSTPETTYPVTDAMFKEYYDRCAPAKCTYTEVGPPTVIESVTLAFGLLGGLMTSLRLVVGTFGGMLFGKCVKDPATVPSDEKAASDVESRGAERSENA